MIQRLRCDRVAYVYAITHIASGMAYIGSTWSIRLRWIDHRRRLRQGIHHCRYLQRAWTKHGPAAFSFTVLDLVAVESHADRLTVERAWIGKAARYNTLGVHSDRASFAHADETKAKLRAINLGKTYSVESKLKRSVATKGRKRNPEATAKTAEFWTGRKHSEEAKARMSASAKARKKSNAPGYWAGRTRPAETKAKMTASQTARWAKMRETEQTPQLALPLRS